MTAQPQFLEQPLPSSPESERVVLGAILLDNQLAAAAAETLVPDDFYSPLHRRAFRAMLALFERGERIEPILIGEELKKEGQLENIGGVATITNLTYGLPHFSAIDGYCKIITDKTIVRNFIRAAAEIQTLALGESEPVEALADYAEQKIFDVCNRPSESKPEQIGGLVFAAQEKTKRIMSGTLKTPGLSTGFTDIDQKTGGLRPSNLVIIAARPSMGKTALCLNIAVNAAILEKAVVAVFSLEMSKEELSERLICSEARIDLSRYKRKSLTPAEVEKADAAAELLSKTKLIVDDTPGISPMQMLAKCRRIISEYKKLDLIVVDYLQLMSGSRRAESRQQEVSQISRELKGIAKMLNVPLIALSQLSRAPEARNPPRPVMSDLRESGSIEQDADVVVFIYRDDYYKESAENAGVAELIFAKQRNGPTGTVKLSFLRELTRFENAYFDNYRSSSRGDTEDDPRFK